MKNLIIAILFTLGTPIYGAATLACTKQAAQHIDMLSLIKKQITINTLHMTPDEWTRVCKHQKEIADIATAKTSTSYTRTLLAFFYDIALKTSCFGTADFISSFVADEEQEASFLEVEAGRDVLTHEYYGTFTNFLKKNGAAYNQPLAHILLSPSTTPLHVLFYVVYGPGDHVFVIEVHSDGRTSWARIYQSWFVQFTLAEWLGIDSWNIHVPSENYLYEQFGQGKRVPQEELLFFFTKMFDFNKTFYIKMLNLAPKEPHDVRSLTPHDAGVATTTPNTVSNLAACAAEQHVMKLLSEQESS